MAVVEIHAELGQIFVLLITIPVLNFLFRKWLPEVAGTVALSALLAHTGWHWMVARGNALLQYNFTMPAFNLSSAATLLRWLMLALIIVGTGWILNGVYGAFAKRGLILTEGDGPSPFKDAEPASAPEPVGIES